MLRHRAPREGVRRRKLASCAGVVGLGQAEAVADATVRGLPHVAERGLPAVWAAAVGVAVLADPRLVADACPAPGPATALTLHPTVHKFKTSCQRRNHSTTVCKMNRKDGVAADVLDMQIAELADVIRLAETAVRAVALAVRAASHRAQLTLKKNRVSRNDGKAMRQCYRRRSMMLLTA